MNNWRDELIEAILQLDEFLAGNSPCVLVMWFGSDDRGRRFIDAEAETGYLSLAQNSHRLVEIFGAYDLPSALQELANELIEEDNDDSSA